MFSFSSPAWELRRRILKLFDCGHKSKGPACVRRAFGFFSTEISMTDCWIMMCKMREEFCVDDKGVRKYFLAWGLTRFKTAAQVCDRQE